VHNFLKGGTITGEYWHTAVSRLTLFLYGANKGDELIFHKLFGDVIQRTELHAFHGGMYFGVIGHYNERLQLSLFAHPAQQVYSVAIRQTQI
jgi:hypothetical protein